ncbi:unnamed protein product [Phaedon cochleariae]|uniref:tRNA-splicing endonuclease subunit Sen2 n=1 Tax=Phaedon cochleariae TaxID=80249 RepID=A0A9N9SPN1_PHACE|nr:unnamed protein product [Phaedon cochleariae]
MELMEPKKKKYCKLPKKVSLPITLKKDGTIHKIQGIFNGFSVTVNDEEDMKNIISMGYFGKANLSRNYPQFSSNSKVEILRYRQYERRKHWGTKGDNGALKKVIVVPDSDSDDDFFTNLKPQYQIDKSGIRESVWLSLEEAFFLLHSVGCLDIREGNDYLNASDCWKLFSETDAQFKYNYIVYYYFRAKNWVVKPGIKFGGDYLLYKQGPPFYHASYVVIIEILDDCHSKIEDLCRRSMDKVSVMSLNRLCETGGKELMICEIILNKNEDIHYETLDKIRINEILVKRWIITHDLP